MCAHGFVIRFAISNSPVEKALTSSTDCTRFSKGRLLRKRKFFRNLGSVIGRPELSHVSTEGGRVGIWTRHLLTNNKPQLLNDRDAQRSLGMSEIARIIRALR